MRDIQKVLDALTSPVRREILNLIWDADKPAGEIAAAFNVTQPTVSQHLSVLKDAGLVTMRVDGNFRRYRANQDVLRGLHAALWGDPSRWTPADDLPERELSLVVTRKAVVATVEVGTDQATTFAAFTDPAVYSRWLGVPVTIEDGRFSCTMEWGTQVRGSYDVVVPPTLLAMKWNFEDDNVPLPGAEMVAYLRVHPAPNGSTVEVHQLIENDAQAAFMEAAWGMVLGRFKSGVGAPREKRPKRHSVTA
jgi:DNA-binding transcriptional ArsR family regulator/uncharacterized protein YndB with AHSA1/START domain